MDKQTISGFEFADWDAYAKCYDALRHLVPYQELLATVAVSLKPVASDIILDAGCGTGNLLLTLSSVCKGATLYGVDSSPNMLARAQSKCVGTRVKLNEASLNTALPFDDNFFNKIGSVNVLYALEDPWRTLVEFRRILAPKGTLVLVTPKKGYDNGLVLKHHCGSEKPDEYWADAHASPAREELLIREAISDRQIIEEFLLVAVHNRRIAKTAIFHFFSECELAELIKNAGFVICEIRSAYAGQAILIVAAKGG
jgi:ubiquinone/menaquinone biosynthesis C-methylase UbiE